ncbi:hypothetical protein QQ045_023701 [Rhodiola kirilowii]
MCAFIPCINRSGSKKFYDEEGDVVKKHRMKKAGSGIRSLGGSPAVLALCSILLLVLILIQITQQIISASDYNLQFHRTPRIPEHIYEEDGRHFWIPTFVLPSFFAATSLSLEYIPHPRSRHAVGCCILYAIQLLFGVWFRSW